MPTKLRAAIFARSHPTRSCIWRPRRTSTGRSTVPAISSRRTSSARISCSKPRATMRPTASATRFAFCTSRRTRSTARWADGSLHRDSPYSPEFALFGLQGRVGSSVRACLHTYGLPVLITNCSNNYGPYQFPEKLIPLMILNALEGKPLPVYGDGLKCATGCSSRITARPRGRCWSGARPGETYNIGGDCERTNLRSSRRSSFDCDVGSAD